MDKNNGSNSSVCDKIRQALASNPAVRAVQRITSFNQDPKPLTKHPKTPSSITNIPIQNKPHSNHKAHKEGSGSETIPIKFDHSTPKLSNGSSAVSSAAKGSERATKVVVKGEPHPQHVPMQGYKQHGHHGVHTESTLGKKPMDINDHFKDFIQQTREKMMRSMTNIGFGQSNHAAAADQEPQHGANKNESHFSDFIQRARKKLRTTTTARKNNYTKKE
ncbi:unnamed protein product [Sphenostylis stenocarpa]|uniref:Uncharacterized protein n=1 Tax=Sphenostylis stenocarpa TaxID=92480 RepID=A0AA86TIP6_9FABA|nr:unnamed protein product [Sphenostylis stenocarpa]